MVARARSFVGWWARRWTFALLPSRGRVNPHATSAEASAALGPLCLVMYRMHGLSAAVANSPASQLGGCIEDGADDFVVAGAPAEVAGEPVARLGLGRIRIAVQQCLGGDQQARRAEAALQRCMFQEFSLQRMQIMTL